MLKSRQIELGRQVRALLDAHGLPSVAAEGFKAPGVVVSYTDDAGLQPARSSSRRVCRRPRACR